MFRIRWDQLKVDIFSNYFLALSDDDGKTWTETEHWVARKPTPKGQMRRQFLYGSFFDPQNGRLIVMGDEGVLPNDESLEGQSYFYPVYRVSEDGGRTWLFEERVIQKGDRYTRERPFDGVRVGANSIWICNAITSRSDGAVIVPAQPSHIGPDGKLYKPPGAYTYLDASVMIGRRTQWSGHAPVPRGAWKSFSRIPWTHPTSSQVLVNGRRRTRLGPLLGAPLPGEPRVLA